MNLCYILLYMFIFQITSYDIQSLGQLIAILIANMTWPTFIRSKPNSWAWVPQKVHNYIYAGSRQRRSIAWHNHTKVIWTWRDNKTWWLCQSEDPGSSPGRLRKIFSPQNWIVSCSRHFQLQQIWLGVRVKLKKKEWVDCKIIFAIPY